MVQARTIIEHMARNFGKSVARREVPGLAASCPRCGWNDVQPLNPDCGFAQCCGCSKLIEYQDILVREVV